MATKKVASKKFARKTSPVSSKTTALKSMPKAGKDPAGGLTAKGRAYFAQTEGAHLKPGVQGPADTPEKMVRKGSFLRRHFANPRGPMKDKQGEPTRLALSAHAWGEPVPQKPEDAKRLASKGHELLEQYHAMKDEAPKKAASPTREGAGAKKGMKQSSKKQSSEAGGATKRSPATKGKEAPAKGAVKAAKKAAKRPAKTAAREAASRPAPHAAKKG